MNDWKVIPTIVISTVLIFGAGVFSGGMLVDYVKQPHNRAVKRIATNSATNQVAVTNAPVRPNKPPEILNMEFLQRLNSELQLTKEQHEAVQKIIAEGQNTVRKAVQDARLEIREVLTPDQRKQFDELVKRPLHKPIVETNPASIFHERLNQMSSQLPERQRTNSISAQLMPAEAQMQMIERERARMTNLTIPMPPLPPPTTNLP